LVHLCGNYLRHVHEWRASGAIESKATRNIKRLNAAGFDYRDPAMLARAVEAIPYDTFTDLEVALLDFMEFITWFTQERMFARWSAANGDLGCYVRFNDYDNGSGHSEFAAKLDRELGTHWKSPV
jgi:hypothetical protein